MMNTVLAIDENMNTYRNHIPAWAKYGLEVQHAATAREAIDRLAKSNDFLLIAMNEEPTADFFTDLRRLHDVTNTQIHVFSRYHSVEKKPLLMQYGAFVYDPHGKRAETNVLNSLGVLQLHQISSRRNKKLPILVCGDIILLLDRRSVSVAGKQVLLTRKEFDILRFFLDNIGSVVTYKQIYRKVWGAARRISTTGLSGTMFFRCAVKSNRPAGAGGIFIPKRSSGIGSFRPMTGGLCWRNDMARLSWRDAGLDIAPNHILNLVSCEGSGFFTRTITRL